jgi:hypothetical protein
MRFPGIFLYISDLPPTVSITHNTFTLTCDYLIADAQRMRVNKNIITNNVALTKKQEIA